MNALKLMVIFLLISLLCLPASAEKRIPRKSMKELSDPGSPSYVPYPYPKNRAEIIEDMKYYYSDVFDESQDSFGGVISITDKIIFDLFKKNSKYKIGEIVKVKNREETLPDDYSWLVYILDEKGDAIMRVSLMASGLAMESGAIDKNEFYKYPPKTIEFQKRLLKVLTEKKVKESLSSALGYPVDDKLFKKMERIGFFTTVGSFNTPLWEITMTDGTIYYYSEIRDMIYSIIEKIPWKKDNRGFRPDKRSLVPRKNYLPDTLNDELVVLDVVTSKNNK
jgi:hypothetical protein